MGSTLTVDNIRGATSSSSIHIPGHVIQVVSATYDTRTEVSGASSASFSDTGLQAQITPSSNTSKILIVFNCNGVAARLGSLHQEPDLRLVRDATELKIYTNIVYQGGTNFWIPGNGQTAGLGNSYYDTPNSTSVITYKIQMRGNINASASTGDMRVAINSSGDGAIQGGGGSSITLMEIAQ